MLPAWVQLKAQQSPLRLWYTAPASKWTEALPIGNGRLGAMIFSGVEQDRIQFNEETLWTGSPRNYNRPGAAQYLDSIRQLIFAGKQKEAEAMAGIHFMGLQSGEGDKEKWIRTVTAPNDKLGDPTLENFNDAAWGEMRVPSYDGWEAVGHEGLDGAVWLRRKFEISAADAAKDLVLDLNRVRDRDYTYINGKLVGSSESTEGRKYKLPAQLLHAGTNTIAILVLNFFDKGGVAGYKDTTRQIGLYPQAGNEQEKISLKGNWKYFILNDLPPATPHYQADYQPFGDVNIHFAPVPFSNYTRALDLNKAIATTTYTANDVHFTRTYFASEPQQAIVVHLSADRQKQISFELDMSSPHKYATVTKIDAQTIALTVQVKYGAIKGASYLRIKTRMGKIAIVGGRIKVSDADDAVIYLTAATNYKNYHDVSADPAKRCMESLSKLNPLSEAQIEAAHIREYQQYFNTFSIDLGAKPKTDLPTDVRLQQFNATNDPSFVALFVQYGRYLLISSSRPGTRPANLQGIWNELLSPPWGSKYTTNINLEMNYWPAELLNLTPMHTPLFNMIGELAESGQTTAKYYYNAQGWVLHHNTDLWRGTAPINASNHGIWVSGGAWLCHHLWEHYLFTQDKEFLKKVYPIMRGAALFFTQFLVKDPKTGWLISAPSNSPEQGGLVAGPSMDHQIIRDLFKNVMAAGEILQTDLPFRKIVRQKYDSIAPAQIGKYGQLQEWMEDKDDTTNKHRHVSHLWGEYPGNEMNWDETPELMKAARQSLLYRGDAATGWSLAWKINFWARFKEGDHAMQLIKMLLTPAGSNAGCYPNLFDAHPPFQIDGNFGAAAGVGEMLVQSHTKYIDLLPALPTAWPQGQVKGICARGGFVLDIDWANGQLVNLSVLSKAGMPLVLRFNGKVVRMATEKDKRYFFNGQLERK